MREIRELKRWNRVVTSFETPTWGRARVATLALAAHTRGLGLSQTAASTVIRVPAARRNPQPGPAAMSL
jgi:hypothetical protein